MQTDDLALEEDVNAAPIVRLVHSVLESAVRTKASDIHIELHAVYYFPV